MKRFSVLLIAAMVLSTVVASANPFSDVPFSHWAYDAVNKLAAKGIIQGYPDGTFKGKQNVTRYALAMITAKMLANVEQMLERGMGGNLVTRSDLQTLEKLTVEFADELALLGVKVTALEDDMQVVKEDVAGLKQDVEGIKDYMARGGMEKVKLSGDMLVRHSSLNHYRDHQSLGFGNVDNVQTQTQLRFQFRAMIDENIHAVARWHMLDRDDQIAGTNNVNQRRWGAGGVGVGGVGISPTFDLAYLHIKDMFRFGGDFTFGRNFYATGHSLLLSDYVDAVKYYRRSGEVDLAFYSIFDSHRGSFRDDGNVNYKNIWAVTGATKHRDHDLYLNVFMQDDPNYADIFPGLGPNVSGLPGLPRLPTVPGTLVANMNPGDMKEDNRLDVEIGSRGPIGRSGHWDYDIGLVHTAYEATIHNPAGNLIVPSMSGLSGHGAVKWDSKREWAAKLGYTFGDEESLGGISLDNDRRYDDGIETPYEDISRGNNFFANGLVNMSALKLQLEYRPRDTKHYFRLAGDMLAEMQDTTTHDLARWAQGQQLTNAVVPANKTNLVYDRWNNLGLSDPTATVLTFEYRYQLAENTRIRVGYTNFDMTGYDRKAEPGEAAIKAGRGGMGDIVNDFDYNMFWTEIYSRF